MVHLLGLLPVIAAESDTLDTAARQQDGFAVHAGAAETSVMLHLRPELVSAAFKTSEPQTGDDWSALVRLARDSSWPGYFGSPRVASAAQGARIVRAVTDAAVAHALKILDGMNPGSIPRLGDAARGSPENVAIDDDALRQERAALRKQEDWLARNEQRK
jgi:hypothetical protein